MRIFKLKFVNKSDNLNKSINNFKNYFMEILPATSIKIVEIAGKGRGVVATQKINKGEIIETCPIIEISKKEADFIQKEGNNVILNYYYLYQEDLQRCCIMLGWGSIYNHSLTPNADIDYPDEKSEKYLQFKALKDIDVGEEIEFNYEFDNNVSDFLKLA